MSITVLPSLAPNVFGSPSFGAYQSNAVYAIENGLTAYGTPGTPTYYQQTSSVTPNQMIVTNFPSWMGQVDPGTVFGPAFANELGNRPTFGVDIKKGASQISISELGFSATSNDPAGLLDFSFSTGSYNYSAAYVGIIYGVGGPTFITSGPNTQLVDEIVGRGSGNADAALCTGCTLAEQQAAIDASLNDFQGMTAFTGTYTMSDGSGVLASGSGTFTVTPEPGSIALLFTAVLGVAFSLRRRTTA